MRTAVGVTISVFAGTESTMVMGVPTVNAGLRTPARSEEHTSELQSHLNLVCRLLLEKKKPIHEPYRVGKQGPAARSQPRKPSLTAAPAASLGDSPGPSDRHVHDRAPLPQSDSFPSYR